MAAKMPANPVPAPSSRTVLLSTSSRCFSRYSASTTAYIQHLNAVVIHPASASVYDTPKPWLLDVSYVIICHFEMMFSKMKCRYTQLAGIIKCEYVASLRRFITAVCHNLTDQHCSSAGNALYCSAAFSRFESRHGEVFFYFI